MERPIKEQILSLFTEEFRDIIRDKHISAESIISGSDEMQIIYIADDIRIKNQYKNEYVKEIKYNCKKTFKEEK